MEALQSTLVLELAEAIAFEASVKQSVPTLTPIGTGAFDCTKFLQRDRELAHRDVVTASAVLKVSLAIQDTWNFTPPRPRVQGYANVDYTVPTLPHDPLTPRTLDGKVVYVKNSSTPQDAAETDRDLYARDAVIYQTLATVCAAFVDKPIQPLDDTIPATNFWPTVSGEPSGADINSALPVNVGMFKKPDLNLADRDNKIAAYVARLARLLRNPFPHAERLYVQITDRYTEVYARINDYYIPGQIYSPGDEVVFGGSFWRALSVTTDEPNTSNVWAPIEALSRRVWVAEPALPGRNRIVYDGNFQTIQWVPEDNDSVHIPKLVALSLDPVALVYDGVDDATISVIAQKPQPEDSEFWREKASRVSSEGYSTERIFVLNNTASVAVSGGAALVDCTALAIPQRLSLNIPSSLLPGNYRVSALVEPSSTMTFHGGRNEFLVGGALGGATLELNVSQIETGRGYTVMGGDGITYNGIVYAAGDSFIGVDGVTTFTPAGAGGSTVRESQLVYKVALPSGSWTATVEYTNLTGTTLGFNMQVLWNDGAVFEGATFPFVDSNGDAIPNGTIVSSPEISLSSDGSVQSLVLNWTGGEGTIHVRSITFKSSDITASRYKLRSALFKNGAQITNLSSIDTIATRNVPEVFQFYFTIKDSVDSAAMDILWVDGGASNLPLKLHQFVVERVNKLSATPNAAGFAGWKHECLERALDRVIASYRRSISLSKEVPKFTTTGVWTKLTTHRYMAFIETSEKRVRSAFRIGTAGDIGKPALVPRGLSYASGVASNSFTAEKAAPMLTALQPWMIPLGIYVAGDAFCDVNLAQSLTLLVIEPIIGGNDQVTGRLLWETGEFMALRDPVAVFSGQIKAGVNYIVSGGDGVRYNGLTYMDGQAFTGLSGKSLFVQAGPSPSTVLETSRLLLG
jgi:hypothetical protein